MIKRLKPKITRYPEGYSPFLVKQLVSAFADPLALLFSSFLSIGKIPSARKRAIIAPIFKKGASSNPANYRPVSVTSVLGKVMEQVVAADMLDYLLSNKLLHLNQNRFLSKWSTLTYHLESISDWTISFDNWLANRVAYIDFSRDFDTVSHPKLLYKQVV